MESKHVLIVEDKPTTAKILQRIVREAGLDIVGIASKGKDAIDIGNKKKPYLVLMDIMLEDDISGIEVARDLSSKFPVKIIFISGSQDPLTEKEYSDVSFCFFISKPFSKDDVMQKISECI